MKLINERELFNRKIKKGIIIKVNIENFYLKEVSDLLYDGREDDAFCKIIGIFNRVRYLNKSNK